MTKLGTPALEGNNVNAFANNSGYPSILFWITPDDFTRKGRSPFAKV